MIDIEKEYSELSLFLKDNNVVIPQNQELDIYNIIELIFEKNSPSTAFYIINLADIIHQLKFWKELFPHIEPRYAVKCNPNKVICQLLGLLGVGFDVASKNEINLVKDYVNDISHVIYANPYKESSSIQYARSMDVDMTVFDSEYELYKIKLYHPNCKLLVRLKVDDKASLCKFSEKFGVDIMEVRNLLECAKNMNLNVIGCCFHVGSGCGDAEQYYSALKIVKEVFDMGEEIGLNMEMIDIGGGFPGMRDDNSEIFLKSIKNAVDRGLTDFFSRDYFIDKFNENRDKPKLKLISEPGRYFVQTSHTLMVNIIGKKVKYFPKDDGKKERVCYYYLNDGIYGSFNCIFFDHQKPDILPYNERDGQRYKSMIFGPTCDSIDKICDNLALPELEIGEWCFVKNFGAYTVAAATDFNGFTKLKAFYILGDVQNNF